MSLSVSDTSTDRRPPTLVLLRLMAVALTAPLLMRAGLPRVQRWLEPAPVGKPPGLPDMGPTVDQMARWVDGLMRRGRPVVRPGCVTRGVTLYDTLRRSGIDVSLCFGVGTLDGEMAGHCWLDLDGRALVERVDPRSIYTEVVRISRAGVTR